MTFMLSRPASPSPREPGPHIGMDNLGAPHVNQTSHLDVDMARDKDKPRLEILLDSPYIVLKGMGVDVEPARLSGHLALYLTESTPIKEITLQFRGKARLPVSPSDSMALNTSPLTYIVCTHDWSFLEGDRKGRAHMLKAGRHLFPFQLQIGGSLPSSVTTGAFGGASVAYKLRAQAVRSGFYQNLQAVLPVPILRSFAAEALEYQQTLEIENTWPEKLMYSIMVPHKAWAAGDKVTALVKFSPLAKGAAVINVSTSIHEQTKVHARSGAQEHTRVAATVKHDFFGSRVVEVKTSRPGHSRGHSQSHSPASPGGSSPGFTPAHRAMGSTSAIGRHFSRTPNQTHSRPSTPPLPPSPVQRSEPTAPALEEEAGNTSDSAESENGDIVTYLSIPIPLTVTPSHGLEPVTVSHRIRWSILILNLDGHTSELRCSLPLHILDYRLLTEARAFSAATRRLLLGSAGSPPAQEEEDIQLPSYKAHVRDRVANMFLPESATVRVANPWISQGASALHSDSPAPTSPRPLPHSGHSTPLEAHVLSHLPHAPGSGSSTPLDWVNSELLLSLSDELPSFSPGPHTPPSTEHTPDSDPQSRRHSRRASRFSSRNTSLDRDRSRAREPPTSLIDATQIPAGGPHETYVHNNNASRDLPSLLQASLKPSSSFSPNHWLPRAHHHAQPPSPAAAADAQHHHHHRGAGGQPHTVSMPAPDPLAGPALLHRAFTEVPDYAVASRGFIGGVPPLESMRGLPSYEETQRTQGEADLAAQLGAMVGVPPSPLSSGGSS